MVHFSPVVAPVLLAAVTRAQYTATYLPSNVPAHTEEGQIGTNQCGTANSQDSLCQNLYINSVTDFCLWAPPYSNGKNSSVGETEQIEVSWCIKPGYGTRLIPDGTIKGAHFVQTPDYVQVTGWGDFTKMNIPANDEGGELDPHGADGMGNPHGGLVFGSSFGKLQQYHEWTNFMSATEFCVRACKDAPNAPKICNHIYDVMGCEWNMPGNYAQGVFENCVGDSAQAMGIYGSSTFHQGDPATPAAHPAPGSSSCKAVSTIGNAPATTSVTSTSAATSAAGSTVASSAATATSTTANGATSRIGGLGFNFGIIVSVGVSVVTLLFGACIAL
ncbi:hypothetical protein BDV93DRAFT_610938 [Ceratobasidium sp. AG-I]|nr:hypothetical protein BDV93DRAFT_612095 [Ceratobasidium sp. AG-I]KAF8596355.1 hypothetical protein BDV93DRAFT_610938 [Ceratobasidium sp. AG-I]